jgi:hypothetical protein
MKKPSDRHFVINLSGEKISGKYFIFRLSNECLLDTVVGLGLYRFLV